MRRARLPGRLRTRSRADRARGRGAAARGTAGDRHLGHAQFARQGGDVRVASRAGAGRRDRGHPTGHQGLPLPRADAGRRGRCGPGPRGRRLARGRADLPADRPGCRSRRARHQAGRSADPDAPSDRVGHRGARRRGSRRLLYRRDRSPPPRRRAAVRPLGGDHRLIRGRGRSPRSRQPHRRNPARVARYPDPRPGARANGAAARPLSLPPAAQRAPQRRSAAGDPRLAGHAAFPQGVRVAVDIDPYSFV